MTPQRNGIPQRLRAAPRTGHQRSAVEGRVKEQYWPGTLMGLGIFFALGSLFTVAVWTLIEPRLLLRIFLVLCLAGNLVPYMGSGLRLGMERLEWFLFNLLAVGPILTSLLLWANFLVHGPSRTSEHRVARVEQINGILFYQFQDDHLDGFKFARALHRDQYPIVGDRVRITEADGLFGMPVVLRKEPFVSAP
jgi:hypothetical protein